MSLPKHQPHTKKHAWFATISATYSRFSLAIVHWGVSPLGLGLQLRPPDFWGTG